MEQIRARFALCELEFDHKIIRSISCSNWIIKLDHKEDEEPQTYCLLPRNKENISQLAKSESSPGKDWIPYKCKILGESANYQIAQIQMRYLNNDTNFSRTKANESKANESKANVPQANVSKVNESKVNESKVNESKVNESKVNVSKDTDGAKCLDPENQDQRKDMGSYVQQYFLLEEQKLRTNKQAKDLVDTIIKVNKLSLRDIENHKRDYYNFPLKTPKDVAEMEEKLKLTSLNHLIIKSHLWKFGPLSNVNDTVPYMLQRLISDDCAKYYVYDEGTDSKYVFKNLMMCSIVIDVAMDYHADSSMDDIEHQIRNWLTVAAMRSKNMEQLRTKKPKE